MKRLKTTFDPENFEFVVDREGKKLLKQTQEMMFMTEEIDKGRKDSTMTPLLANWQPTTVDPTIEGVDQKFN